MKSIKHTLTLVFLLMAVITQAQVPQGIPYQAAARNSSGAVLASTNISVRFTIKDSITSGAILYRETHSVTTSAQGMFSVYVGEGTPVLGTFSGINWGINAKFLQVEMDPASGSSYIDMGTQQMMSVPYALYAGSKKFTVSTTGDTLYSGDGNYVIISGISAANCILPSAGTITGTATVPVGSTTMLSNAISGGMWSSSNSVRATVSSTGLVSGVTAGTARISYTVTNSCGSAVTTRIVTVNVAVGFPVLTTTGVEAIVSCAASSGGTISGDGGFAVTARGVVWSTSTGPTVALTTKTSNGTGTGTFISTITGLAPSTTYYVRAYATNSIGTAYGSEYSFTTLGGSMCIGATYGGGKIAYILQPGDPGYIVGEIHGFIAAPSDLSGYIRWHNGSSTHIEGAMGFALGDGMSNTNAIVTAQGAGTYAAKLCADLVLGGYSDWYLPSIQELEKLYINRSAIGGFATSFYYWSSTQYHHDYVRAMVVYFWAGSTHWSGKENYYWVRAVRSF